MPTNPNGQLIARIVDVVPSLRPVYDEHMRFTDGELLPHVCLSAMTRMLDRWITCGSEPRAADAQRTLELLEEAIGSGDPDVVDLISLSFLESLDPRSGGYGRLRSMMGPRLRAELDRYERGG